MMVVYILCFISILPFWGLLGFVSDAIGFRNSWEAYLLGAYFGFCLGAVQVSLGSEIWTFLYALVISVIVEWSIGKSLSSSITSYSSTSIAYNHHSNIHPSTSPLPAELFSYVLRGDDSSQP